MPGVVRIQKHAANADKHVCPLKHVQSRVRHSFLWHCSIACYSALIIGCFGFYDTAPAQVVEEDPIALRGIDVVEHLGDTLPLDLQFTNAAGLPVRLGDRFGQELPVLLTLVYFECPMLCTLVLNGLTDGLRKLDWTPGEDYRLLSVSIDPRETPELARPKQHRYLQSLGKTEDPAHWPFWVGAEDQITALTEALGFQYFYDEAQDQYGHPAVAFVLTPDGRISRYLYGIEFPSRDLKFALMDASEGKLGSTIDRLILSCFHYDPQAGGYVVMAGRVMRIGGTIGLAALSLLVGILWLRERRRKQSAALTH